MIRLLAVLTLLCGPAWGQDACADRAGIAFRLGAMFGETHQFTLISGQYLIEVWMNDKSQTWTVVRSKAGEASCIIASGKGVLVEMVREPRQGG